METRKQPSRRPMSYLFAALGALSLALAMPSPAASQQTPAAPVTMGDDLILSLIHISEPRD